MMLPPAVGLLEFLLSVFKELPNKQKNIFQNAELIFY
jgi:hypothetical protein